MKQFFYFYGVLLLLIIGCNTTSSVKSISVNELESVIANTDSIQIVDVRTPKEWQSGVIPEAIKIDVNAPRFLESAEKNIDPSKPVYLYCRSGRRSMIACELLRDKGYNVYNIEGGYLQLLQTYKD
ncbi:rhodanese-like domain-containing protein [Tenacibaculum sp. SG-28]|uniref:rhodanese-like domain-containing protein n=1 Tax=Tenacibaculum sp. SG-28 TaxID=754426 RepID=UPI000CF458CC|nr:rhodanese-like domain-containing protein [Tenacibaculum sp. SG-28]PQJ21198.1 hypothetical protein BSU00_09440 [Tenacibaculum sp. SG-28]